MSLDTISQILEISGGPKDITGSVSKTLSTWTLASVIVLASVLFFLIAINMALLFLLFASLRRQRRELLMVQLRERGYHQDISFFRSHARWTSPAWPPPPAIAGLMTTQPFSSDSAVTLVPYTPRATV
ncbi:hypothetical protein C8J57DRAFT_1521412 [Mycena rebaudengoi]|nr:hypothetical protein C8J57DRAFT_1521412 [Mycena rebaudengoi]